MWVLSSINQPIKCFSSPGKSRSRWTTAVSRMNKCKLLNNNLKYDFPISVLEMQTVAKATVYRWVCLVCMSPKQQVKRCWQNNFQQVQCLCCIAWKCMQFLDLFKVATTASSGMESISRRKKWMEDLCCLPTCPHSFLKHKVTSSNDSYSPYHIRLWVLPKAITESKLCPIIYANCTVFSRH